MDLDGYWALVDAAIGKRKGKKPKAVDADAVAARLGTALEALPAAEIEAFEVLQNGLLVASYSWSLWGAAYLINGGCSDDGFDYFRGWLLAQGRDAFDGALRDPDSLAAIVDGDEVECDEMLYVPARAYEKVVGADMPLHTMTLPDLGDGWDFDDDDEMKKRYPRLHRKVNGG